MSIKPDQLAEAVERGLREYSEDVAAGVKKAVVDEGKQCVKDIRVNIDSAGFEQRTGDYRKSWKSKKTEETASTIHVSVYAGSGQYRLTHLLEKGHAKVNGRGRTRAFEHIKPADDAVSERLIKKCKSIVKGGEA